MNKEKGKEAWEMLGFQYKPMEKRFLQDLQKYNQSSSPMAIKYKNSDYLTKIKILDLYAKWLGC